MTAAAASTLLVLGSVPVAVAAPEPAAPVTPAVSGRYIVTLTDDPLATYDGGVTGLGATKPAKGKRIDTGSAAFKRYQDYLVGKQAEAAARVGAKPARSYSVALNGFATELTADQAKILAHAKGVLAVSKDTRRQLSDDHRSTDLLKLSGTSGVWSALGGTSKAGRGVVIGVLDSGYWPESKSFAGAKLGTAKPTASDPYRPYRSGDTIVMKKADGGTFKGVCQAGEDFPRSTCNTKVVGARYFPNAFRAVNGPFGEADYSSPRDVDGHGSHTASTAAGNAGVSASVKGRSFGSISGVAPAAKLAIYKVDFSAENGAKGVFNSDAIAAIDAAVTDGVDVINYSVSGTDSATDPVDLAFLSAASAGIFVATSAGNSGPGAGTLEHPSPWLTTVGASTVQRYESTLKLGNGKAYAGVSTTVASKVSAASLVESTKVRATGADADDALSCLPKTLDPAKTAGRIVICQRGGNDRLDKSAEVKRAGGVAMVLVNPRSQDLDGDSHTVPTIHLNPPAASAVRAYAKTGKAKASLVPTNTTGTSEVYPQIAPFSSRGPSVGNGGDILKPDLAAPGVDTLAAVSPPGNEGNSFAFYSGTSMSSPHVAGLAALYFGVHPTWSPMAVKSALMTTAAKVELADGSTNHDRFAEGAGNVRPDRMLNPGVVFDSGEQDWMSYLEGQGVQTDTAAPAVDPSNYNSSSIAVGKLVGTQTVTRRLTAVKTGLYRASVSVPGLTATVSPSSVSFTKVGQTRTVKVKLTRKEAAIGTPVFGALTLTGASTTARVPIAVTPQAVEAPAVVTGKGASGTIDYSVRPGVSGPFPLTRYGLAKSNLHTGQVSANGDTVDYDVTIPAGSKIARFALTAYSAASDVDLAVYRQGDGDPELVGTSAGPTGNELVTLSDPAAGKYIVEVLSVEDPKGAKASGYEVSDVVVGSSTDLGNFTVTPTSASATAGQPVPVSLSWSGLDAKASYLGLVRYPDKSYTLVEIN